MVSRGGLVGYLPLQHVEQLSDLFVHVARVVNFYHDALLAGFPGQRADEICAGDQVGALFGGDGHTLGVKHAGGVDDEVVGLEFCGLGFDCFDVRNND